MALVSVFVVNAQNYGKITIYSKDNQFFLVSFNGVRWHNDYKTKAALEYAEDNDYKVKLWLPRNNYPINFNITSTPGFETVYTLDKDQYGAYALNLESKIKFNAIPPSNTTTTVPASPTIAVVTEMKDEDFKAKWNSVKSESFDDKRIAKIKFLFAEEHLSSTQSAELVKLFSFDSKKVDAGKILYKRTIDKKNYYKVVDTIDFDSYKKDLQDWIAKNP